jgi:1-acyl-sn-glycerol-3-phosphate acyltransferase
MYYFLIGLARLLIFLLTRYTLLGKENIPPVGPFILVSNHLSVADPVVIGASTRRKVIFVAKEEVFRNRFAAYILRQWGSFPIYRGQTDMVALRNTGQVLKSGRILGIFPEGTRSKNGRLQPASDAGTALITHLYKAPVLPVGISGTEKIRGFGWIWRRPRIILKIGQPITFADVQRSQLNREDLARDTAVIMQHIADLLPEKYRGQDGSHS